MGFLRTVIVYQIPKSKLSFICYGAGVPSKHFGTRWPGLRSQLFLHLSVCVTMGKLLSLSEPEVSPVCTDDTDVVLNELTRVKNLEQYLTAT